MIADVADLQDQTVLAGVRWDGRGEDDAITTMLCLQLRRLVNGLGVRVVDVEGELRCG